MSAVAKPLPHPDRDSEPFWQGVREGELRLQRCGECRTLRFPPREICNRCYSERADWDVVSGRGRLVSWCVTHQVFNPAYADDVPYTVLQVALEEQDDVQMIGRLEGEAELRQGLPLRAVFVRASDTFDLIHWEADDAPSTPEPSGP